MGSFSLLFDLLGYFRRRLAGSEIRSVNLVKRTHEHGGQNYLPTVTIVIPTRDKVELLAACIDSVKTLTSYSNYEILIINNGSVEEKTISYLEHLSQQGDRVLDYPGKFNFSSICNMSVESSNSQLICFLNNDTVVIEPTWLGLMVDHAVQPDVGVVGSRLVYENGAVQHIGVAVGITGAASHPFSGKTISDPLVSQLSRSCFEVSAVTFACAMVSKSLFKSLGGMDPKFRVGLNDIDFSLEALAMGRKNVMCGLSCLTHLESKSRNSMTSPQGAARASLEVLRFLKKYRGMLSRDLYFRR
ncbi:MAG: hypothetical protein RL228_1117 [Actinomycetota bacterium]